MRHSSSKPCVTCPIRVLCLHLRVPRWSLINESLKFEHAFRLSIHRQAIIVKLQAASLDCTEMIQNLAVVCCCPLGTTSGEKKLKLCGCGCAEGPNLSHDHKIAQPSKRWDRKVTFHRFRHKHSQPFTNFQQKKVTGSPYWEAKQLIKSYEYYTSWLSWRSGACLRDLRDVGSHSRNFLQPAFPGLAVNSMLQLAEWILQTLAKSLPGKKSSVTNSSFPANQAFLSSTCLHIAFGSSLTCFLWESFPTISPYYSSNWQHLETTNVQSRRNASFFLSLSPAQSGSCACISGFLGEPIKESQIWTRLPK